MGSDTQAKFSFTTRVTLSRPTTDGVYGQVSALPTSNAELPGVYSQVSPIWTSNAETPTAYGQTTPAILMGLDRDSYYGQVVQIRTIGVDFAVVYGQVVAISGFNQFTALVTNINGEGDIIYYGEEGDVNLNGGVFTGQFTNQVAMSGMAYPTTISTSLVSSESNSLMFSSAGTVTLPSSEQGVYFLFSNHGGLEVNISSSDPIVFSSGSMTYVSLSGVGSHLGVVGDGSSWIATEEYGAISGTAPFDFASISDLGIWLDPLYENSLETVDSKVASWGQRAGSREVTLTQPSGALRPSVNGEGLLEFANASGNYLLGVPDGGGVARITTDTSHTVFLVVEPERVGSAIGNGFGNVVYLEHHEFGGDTNDSAYFSYRPQATEANDFWTYSISDAIGHPGGNPDVVATVNTNLASSLTNDRKIIRIQEDFTSRKVFVNGVDQLQLTTSDATQVITYQVSPTGTAIGFYEGAATPGYNGLLGDIICYDRILASGEISAVETALATKWGVTL